mmetsp:Transcript_10335/g.14591  ORF Transcript_10335/g.14591 Transcript_10335/m.14591 type:complete len:104 (+) Transcript_10335:605-916(+)
MSTVNSPTRNPPIPLHTIPQREIPPFVPGGTRRNVVIKTGSVSDRMPNSDASVSANTVAWCARTALAKNDAKGASLKLIGCSSPQYHTCERLHMTDTILLQRT